MQKDASANNLPARKSGTTGYVASFFVFFILSLSPGIAYGQQQKPDPVVVFSWKSPTLVPSGYTGKAMPVFGSRVSVSADVFADGALVDPDLLFYTWSLNGTRLTSGNGLRRTSFTVKSAPQATSWIRVEIDFSGTVIEKNFFIPTAEPRVVVTQQRPYNMLREGANLFSAHPFFFSAQNISSLSLAWLFNGSPVATETTPGNKFVVDILPQTPPGASASVGIEVGNNTNVLERASQTLSVKVQ